MTVPSPFTGQPLTRGDANRLAGMLKALTAPARLQILSLLHIHTGLRDMDLAEPLGLTQPTVSFHLRTLADAGFLRVDDGDVVRPLALNRSVLAELGAALHPPKTKGRRRR